MEGVLPLAPSLDHVGVMARCVRDLAFIYEAIATDDFETDDCQLAINDQIDPADRYPPIVNLLTGFFESEWDSAARSLFRSSMPNLVQGPGEYSGGFVAKLLPAGFAEIPHDHKLMMAVEAAAYHGIRYQRHPEDYPPRIAELIREGQQYRATDYAEANRKRFELLNELNDGFRGSHSVTPATPGAAPDLSSTGPALFNLPWSFLGFPTVSIPYARDREGMPHSLQFIGWRHGEDRLLATAAWYEIAAKFIIGLPELTELK